MKFVAIFTILSAITSQALARQIVLGKHNAGVTDREFKAAWISGVNPCERSSRIVYGDENPCGFRFSIAGFDKIHFENCGRDDAPL
jgi:hypothetical protein